MAKHTAAAPEPVTARLPAWKYTDADAFEAAPDWVRSAAFASLVAAIDAGRLRVAEGCPFRLDLAAELLQARSGPSGAESRGPGHHGDLMTAVALALWWQGAARLSLR